MKKIDLHLVNFKCHKDCHISLNNLTLLTGANAAGKSSIIQSLLLLNSALTNAKVAETSVDIRLNDENRALDLGIVDRLISNDSKSDCVEIELDKQKFYFLVGEEPEPQHLVMHIPALTVETNVLIDNIRYLAADRKGPQYEVDLYEYMKKNCGVHGQYTASVIYNNQFTKIQEDRTFELEDELNFRRQLDAWLTYIFPGISLAVQAAGNSKCQVWINNASLRVNNVATNVGFGITYALPILVTCLLAQDEFVLIENPEAHLHAKAQSNLGYFLGVMAAAGVRILIETHSEHIVNGIRRAIAEGKRLTPDKASIYFFNSNDQEISVKDITIDAYGNLSAFPVDFFDQQRQDSKAIYDYMRQKRG